MQKRTYLCSKAAERSEHTRRAPTRLWPKPNTSRVGLQVHLSVPLTRPSSPAITPISACHVCALSGRRFRVVYSDGHSPTMTIRAGSSTKPARPFPPLEECLAFLSLDFLPRWSCHRECRKRSASTILNHSGRRWSSL